MDPEAEDQAARTRARIALEEAITSHARTAHRLPYVVARMDADPRTKWDAAHKRIDELLTLWELAA